MPSPESRTVSALLPVHAGVAGSELAAALESLLVQTCLPDEVVIVEDGPLEPEARGVIDDFEVRHPAVTRLRLPRNEGAGVANQAGLSRARGHWVVKVDADDISVPERIERQLAAVERTGADVCGAAMWEFVAEPQNVVSVRRMPADHEAIGARMRWNNPVNHPTAFFRREVALRSGGYPPWRHMQDYGLMARMYAAGARMMNVEDPLVLFRSSDSLVGRRRSRTARDLERTVQRELCALGIVNTPRSLFNVAWRTAFRRLPTGALVMVNRRLLARRPVR